MHCFIKTHGRELRGQGGSCSKWSLDRLKTHTHNTYICGIYRSKHSEKLLRPLTFEKNVPKNNAESLWIDQLSLTLITLF